MVEKYKFQRIGGFSSKFNNLFYGIDLCLRLYKDGWRTVYTPYIKVYTMNNFDNKNIDLELDSKLFFKKYSQFLKKGDPYYNTNLTLEKEDYSIKV